MWGKQLNVPSLDNIFGNPNCQSYLAKGINIVSKTRPKGLVREGGGLLSCPQNWLTDTELTVILNHHDMFRCVRMSYSNFQITKDYVHRLLLFC